MKREKIRGQTCLTFIHYEVNVNLEVKNQLYYVSSMN
jgi:hypothetical protein